MKIRITGRSLPIAQAGGQQPDSITINGILYQKGTPGYDEALKGFIQAKQEGDDLRAQVNAHFGQPAQAAAPQQVTAPQQPVAQQPTAVPQQQVFDLKKGLGNIFNPTGNLSSPYTWMQTGQTLPSPKGPTQQAQAPVQNTSAANPIDWNTINRQTTPSGAFVSKDGLYDSSKGFVTKQDTDNLTNQIKTSGAALQNTFNTGSARQIRQGIKDFNQQYNTNLKAPGIVFGAKGKETVNSMAALGDAARMGIGMASTIVDAFDDNKKYKEMQQWKRNQSLSDNLFPVDNTPDKGDYSTTGTTFGMLRPDQYVVNKGMYTGMFYPSMQEGGIYDTSFNVLTKPVDLDPSLLIPDVNPFLAPATQVMMDEANNESAASAPTAAPYKGSNSHIAHNNPGNIHIGKFAQKYGATAGRGDVGGKVAVFPDIATGKKAMEDLLFGSGYNNLTVQEARRKWVGFPTDSEKAIVKAVGNKKLGDMTPAERKKLMNEFTRWEDINVYNYLKDNNLQFAMGGENNEPMGNIKIRITGNNSMEYGGQKGFGLDLGRRAFNGFMQTDAYDSVGQSVSEDKNPDAPHVLEAEGGETIVHPDGAQFSIQGDRHTQGGVKLTSEQAPEGSFIFSDTKKLKIKDPEMLKHFGKSYKAGGITPAEISKQYNINQYKAVLENPDADELSKKTAKMMVDNYNQKRAQLALLQESMKGFPQGIPDIAQSAMPQAAMGGMMKYQAAGEVDEAYRKRYADLDPYREDAPFTNFGDVTNFYRRQGYPGDKNNIDQWQQWMIDNSGKDPRFKTKFIDYLRSVPLTNLSKQLFPGKKKSDLTDEQLMQQFHDKKFDFRAPRIMSPVEIEPRKRDLTPPQIKVPPIDRIPEIPTTTTTTDDNDYTPQQGTPGVTAPPNYNAGHQPFFSYNLFVGPKRRGVYAAPLAVNNPEPTFYDPNREIAGNQEQSNAMMDYMANFAGPQSFFANSSGAQGKLAQSVADTMSRTQNQNVQVANQFSGLQSENMNKANLYNAERMNNIAWNNEQADMEYRNNMAKWLQGIGMEKRQRYYNNTKDNMLNATNPYYYISHGPYGATLNLKPGTDAYAMATGRQAGAQSAQSAASYAQAITKYKQAYPGLSDADYRNMYAMDNGMMPGKGTTRSASRSAAALPFMQAYGAGNAAYQGGYDMSDLYDYDNNPFNP